MWDVNSTTNIIVNNTIKTFILTMWDVNFTTALAILSGLYTFILTMWDVNAYFLTE